MGSPASEVGRKEDETQHQVTLTTGFWMAKTETRQGLWVRVMGNNPSSFKRNSLPVETVSWDDVQEYLAKMNSKHSLPLGWEWVLPTEGQWEYACRAGTGTAFSFGNVFDGKQANCDGNYPYGTSVKGPDVGKTTAVGSYTANSWGLFDMHGNVWEWCADWYGEYASGSATNPQGATSGSERVIRGGGWADGTENGRSASRLGGTPDDREDELGFRVAAVPTGRNEAGEKVVALEKSSNSERSKDSVSPEPMTPQLTMNGNEERTQKRSEPSVSGNVRASSDAPRSGVSQASEIPASLRLDGGVTTLPSNLLAPSVPALPTNRGMEGNRAGEVREFGGIEMVWCPAGTFSMGSPEREEGREDNETQHRVTLSKGFWMAKTETTQGQGGALMGNNPSHFKDDALPLECVSWEAVQEWVSEMNSRHTQPSGWKWALPTEAQWEYACRAGTTTMIAGDLDEMGWYGENSGSKTKPVGTKKANAWGLHDMQGNVEEWCSDWYGEYTSGAATDPTGPTAGVFFRVLRGGSWGSRARQCRSASRKSSPPDTSLSYFGFRPALVPSGR